MRNKMESYWIMNTSCLYFILYLILSPVVGETSIEIDRELVDSRLKILACDDEHTTSTFWTCICLNQFNTIMSSVDATYLCKSPNELGCYHSLLKSKQTYLVTHGNTTKQIIPSLPNDNPSIHIYVWNLISGDDGGWLNVTKEASQFFDIKSNSTPSNHFLSITHFDKNLWKGHVIKIEFVDFRQVDKHCLTIKVEGKRQYPFDIDRFRDTIPKPAMRLVTEKTISRHEEEFNLTFVIYIVSGIAIGLVAIALTTGLLYRIKRFKRIGKIRQQTEDVNLGGTNQSAFINPLYKRNSSVASNSPICNTLPSGRMENLSE